jgi:hypothetical protein
VLTAVKEWPGSGGASGEVGVPAILDGRCARRLLDQASPYTIKLTRRERTKLMERSREGHRTASH